MEYSLIRFRKPSQIYHYKIMFGYFFQYIFLCFLQNNVPVFSDQGQLLENFLNTKKDVTILVTDSGLGGLSVTADLGTRLAQSGVFKNAQVIFFNSLFHNRSGYNSLKSDTEKVRIFNAALEAMSEKYHPDLLLIACNTLSVLYDKTPFSKCSHFPVVGIVETGVELIAERFEKTPEATVIIFATKTTIRSNSHKNRLIQKGYSADRIVGQACPHLAGSIERGYNSEETDELIKKYVHDALKKISDSKAPIFVSLNCTHYAYSRQQFLDAFTAAGYPSIEILDANPRMCDFLFRPQYLHRYPETNVTVEVVSKTKINENKRKLLGKLLRLISFQTAEALMNYRHDPDLFDAKFDSIKIGM